MARRSLPVWLQSRNLRLLIASRTTMSVARALAGIVVPIYLARVGFNAIQLGVLFTVTGLTSGVLTACVGLLADRYGRRPFMVVFPLFTGAAAIAFLETRAIVPIIAFSALGSIGRGGGAGAGAVGPYAPAQQSLMAASVEPRDRSAAFGVMAFCSIIGALIGGLLASIPDLASHFGLHGLASYRPAFLLLAALSLVTALLAVPMQDKRSPLARRGRFVSLPRRSLPLLMRLSITNAVNGFATGTFGPFITYWFYIRYGAGPGQIGLLFAVINIASAAPNLAAAGIARRLGLVRAVTVVRVIAAALVFVMAIMPNFLLAGAFYLVRMVVQRVGMPLRQSYVMGLAPEEERASVAGLSNLPSQVTSAASAPVAGYLFEHVSLVMPFALGGVLQLANAALYYGFFHDLPPPEELEAHQAARRARDERPAPELRTGEPRDLNLSGSRHGETSRDKH